LISTHPSLCVFLGLYPSPPRLLKTQLQHAQEREKERESKRHRKSKSEREIATKIDETEDVVSI